jgi:putative ABC transport system substrate-binding protein
MKRREFIAFLGGMAAVMPLAARAQQHFKIGLLDTGVGEFFTVPFMQRLEQLGYVEGRNLVVERRFAEGDKERLKEFAADLVRQKVDVIVTMGTPAGLAAEQATSTIPIVLGANADPVRKCDWYFVHGARAQRQAPRYPEHAGPRN